jgi:hypothetical protein
MKNYVSARKELLLKKTGTYPTSWNIMQNYSEINMHVAQFNIST